MDFDRVIEKLIRQAQEEGKFNNLIGAGKPLRLDENPFEDPTWALANQMLKNQGFRPEWLEADLALREEYGQACQALARARDWRAAELARLGQRADAQAVAQQRLVAHEWSLAQDRFRRRLNEINQALFTLNLKVPHTRFQRLKLDVEAELNKVLAAK